jgi:hypothetical protein
MENSPLSALLVNFILFFLFYVRARRDDRGEQRKNFLPLIFISLKKARKIFNELYFMLLCGTIG